MDAIQTKSVPRKPLPMRVAQFDVAEFAAWLARNGAEIGIPSNPYEVIRYRSYVEGATKPMTHIVYRKESGTLTWNGLSQQHYVQFLSAAQMWPGSGYPPNEHGETPLLITYPSGGPPGGWIRPDGGNFRKDMDKGAAPTSQERRRARLLERDGDRCWFCDRPMGNDITIEHLVPKSAGGRDMLANYALAHAKCNHDAGNLPLVKKIELRTRLHAQHRMLAE